MSSRRPSAIGHAPSTSVGSKFLGISEHAVSVRRLLRKCAKSDATVLITGESGVGKEVAAREIHRLSDRNKGSFLAVNCAAIPEPLIESELFGHEAGAFTDARNARRGAFQQAAGGTLLLDEIGELSLGAQPKLLRALESEVITPVGGEVPYRNGARLIASTNVVLSDLCQARGFRTDLYYRLCVLEIEIRPLRERAEDIDLLAQHFIYGCGSASSGAPQKISGCGMRLLRSHSWPGNVRELKHSILRAVALSSGGTLTADSFNLGGIPTSPELARLLSMNWRDAKLRLAEIYARTLLTRHGGSVHDAAEDAGVTVGGFYKWIRKMNIDP